MECGYDALDALVSFTLTPSCVLLLFGTSACRASSMSICLLGQVRWSYAAAPCLCLGFM